MSFLPAYVFVIALSFMVSLSVYFRPLGSNKYLRLFPPFLLCTTVLETVCQYLRYKGQENVVIYNFFSMLEFCFYLWLISLIIKNIKVKRLTRIVMIAYAVLALMNIVFVQGIHKFHSNSYCLGCLLVVAFSIYYFLELFRLAQETSLIKNPAFWICTGLLFFYCCSFPFFGLINYWSNIPQFLLDNFLLISNVLNIFLYSLFIIAFLWAKTQKYTFSRS